MDARTHGRMDAQTHGGTDGRTDGSHTPLMSHTLLHALFYTLFHTLHQCAEKLWHVATPLEVAHDHSK